MKYDPNNELSNEQLDKLSEDEFFEYLDSKSEYVKQFSKSLGQYHTKRFAVINAKLEGRELTEDELKFAKDVGKEGDMKSQQRIIDAMNEKGWEEPDKKVKNRKTHRSQWFD